jgi:hypothetical protein
MRSYENVFKHIMDDEKFQLPVGFRFHPTDEELINQYLLKKVIDDSFCAIAIAEIDMNKCEPWDLAGEFFFIKQMLVVIILYSSRNFKNYVLKILLLY